MTRDSAPPPLSCVQEANNFDSGVAVQLLGCVAKVVHCSHCSVSTKREFAST